jgi:hypothetical protein
MPKSPPPSATRYGQNVDNPPLENSDTARLRVLLEQETQDDWHRQEGINTQVTVTLERYWGYIRQHEEKLAKVAWGGEVANLWKVLAILVSVLLAALGWMFIEVISMGKIIAVCCSTLGGPK